jgi:hypothetical protein
MQESAQGAPVAIRILREQQRLELDWRDGHVSAYEAIPLRWLCPCAYCRGEAGLPGWLDANPTLSPSQTKLEGVFTINDRKFKAHKGPKKQG